jgi:putative Holliday junction resolvase
MRILGIDYGSKRVGIAISDPSESFGQPYKVLKNSDSLLKDIQDIITKEEISEIVIGESKDFKGKDNVVMEAIREFKKILELETKLPVIFEPEFLSSHQAAYFQGQHDLLDASAAAIILQSYLERKKNNR